MSLSSSEDEDVPVQRGRKRAKRHVQSEDESDEDEGGEEVAGDLYHQFAYKDGGGSSKGGSSSSGGRGRGGVIRAHGSENQLVDLTHMDSDRDSPSPPVKPWQPGKSLKQVKKPRPGAAGGGGLGIGDSGWITKKPMSERGQKPQLRSKPKAKARTSAGGKAKAGRKRGRGGMEIDEDDDSYDEDEDEDEDEVIVVDSDEEDREAKVRAQKAMKQCANISKRLQQALSRWQYESQRNAAAPVAAEQGEGEENEVQSAGGGGAESGCVNLIAMTPGKASEERGDGGWYPTDQSSIEACLAEGIKLKPYQVVGVNWLLLLDRQKVSGVLADDMGLGKTIQSISFFAVRKQSAFVEERPTPTNLVVVPASVLANWRDELARFAPELTVEVYHGSVNERQMVKGRVGAASRRGEPVDVVVTTYTYFERESASDDRSFLKKIEWDYLVLDEAHALKNMKTERWKHLKRIKTNQRILLSGTPVQNNLRELLVLLDFLNPHVFKLVEHMGREDEMGEKPDPVKILLAGLGIDESKAHNDAALKQVRGLLTPFVLRRLKSQVLNQLTPKTNHVVRITPTSTQTGIYNSILERHIARQRQRAGGSSNATKLVGSDKEAQSVFTALRKAANHPLLLLHKFNDPRILSDIANRLWCNGHFGDQCTEDMVRKEIDGYCDMDLHQICYEYGGKLDQYTLSEDDLYASAKMDHLRTLLPKLVSEGHRVLLFSQWTRLLDILEMLMEKLELDFMRLDGSTPVGERQDLINRFNSSKTINVFLLSTRAGGLGINLTAADTVILHDLDFNPIHDRQAEDRCHRIGQTRPVSVYKMVAAGTVDEKILTKADLKTEVNSALLDGTPSKSDSAGPASRGDGGGHGFSSVSAILADALKTHLD